MAAAATEVSRQVQTMPTRILIADDQPDIVGALHLLLKANGYATESVSSPAELLATIAQQEFDLILMDLNYARDTTSGREGLDLLAQLNALEGTPPIIVMTGWATVGIAVEAMQHGVTDFVEKPWTNAKLLQSLQKQLTLGRERKELARSTVRQNQAHQEVASQLHRHEQEIAEARSIQEGFLPKQIPQLPGYELASAWQSARVVGGDYFDVLPFGGETVGLCIADVAGKGMPAALLMSNMQAAVRGLASADLPVDELCTRLNTLLCRNIASDRFITFFYAQLDGASRTAAIRECRPQSTHRIAPKWFARPPNRRWRRLRRLSEPEVCAGERYGSNQAIASFCLPTVSPKPAIPTTRNLETSDWCACCSKTPPRPPTNSRPRFCKPPAISAMTTGKTMRHCWS